MALYGPMIEGVASPTASETTRRAALGSAATPDAYGYGQYAGTRQAMDEGLNTAGIVERGHTLGAANEWLQGSGFLAGTTRDMLAAAGWTPSADGGWVHTGSGRAIDSQGVETTGATTTTTTTAGEDEVVTETGEPTGPEGPGGGDGPGGGLGQVSQEAIEAQINALTAQYGLDLEGIAALGGEIGAQARFLMAQLNRDKGFAQEDMLGALVGRGVFRSGITARDTGRLEGDFAARRAQVEMNKGQQLRQLAERAGLAKIGLMRGKADVISQIDAGNLNAEVRQALLNELNSLSPEQVQQALTNTNQPLPELNLTDEELANKSTFAGGSSATSGYSPIKF